MRFLAFAIRSYNCFCMIDGQLAKDDYLELRQEASQLQEYSNAKLDRVTRYLGVLADKSRKLGEGFSFVVCRIIFSKHLFMSWKNVGSC